MQNTQGLFHRLVTWTKRRSEYGDVHKCNFVPLGLSPLRANVPSESFVANNCANSTLAQPIKIGLVFWATANKDAGHSFMKREATAGRSTTTQNNQPRQND